VVGSLLLALNAPVFAFEEGGHNMVAQLTMPYLNDGAKAELMRLYGDNWSRDVVAMASSIQSELNRPKNEGLQPLQQTLFRMGDTEFDPAIHCPNNACSVAAILESRQVLLKSNFADSDKRQALLFLMHYMLQLHIPVNAGLQRDMGGQKIYLKNDDLQPVNFAWIWNHDLYRRQGKRWFSYAQELYRSMSEINTDDWVTTTDVQSWAMETHTLAIEKVYPLAAEGRYSANLIKEGTQILEMQLMKAAFRTAYMLNDMFGTGEPEMTE
jgi:hypothetical protein